jgi:hypothetical protein
MSSLLCNETELSIRGQSDRRFLHVAQLPIPQLVAKTTHNLILAVRELLLEHQIGKIPSPALVACAYRKKRGNIVVNHDDYTVQYYVKTREKNSTTSDLRPEKLSSFPAENLEFF